MDELEKKLNVARDALESASGYAIWARAPVAIKDALNNSLFYLNRAARVASRSNITLYRKDKQMKELIKMLDAFNAVKSNAVATTERLSKVGSACARLNADLDGFFEAAGIAESEFVGEGEAAPNGELGDGTETEGGAAAEGETV